MTLALQGVAAAVAFSAAFAGTWHLPVYLSILINFGAMILSQTRGSNIIGTLHNDTAAILASAPPEDVMPDTALDELCAGYESHHWESTSNCLHTAGCIIGLYLIASAITALVQFRVRRTALLLSFVPPTWYLYAWCGHFLYQADIPAVFTYGTTLRGWVSGEWCSISAIFAGRAIGNHPLNSLDGRSEIGLTALLILVYALVAVPAAKRKLAAGSAAGHPSKLKQG